LSGLNAETLKVAFNVGCLEKNLAFGGAIVGNLIEATTEPAWAPREIGSRCVKRKIAGGH
jgi:hypothetical protein